MFKKTVLFLIVVMLISAYIPPLQTLASKGEIYFEYNFNDYEGQNIFDGGSGSLGSWKLIAEACSGMYRPSSGLDAIGGKSVGDRALKYTVSQTSSDKSAFFGPWTNAGAVSIKESYFSASKPAVTFQWDVYCTVENGSFTVFGRMDATLSGSNHYKFSDIKVGNGQWHTIGAEFVYVSAGKHLCNIYADNKMLGSYTASNLDYPRYCYLYLNAPAAGSGIMAVDNFKVYNGKYDTDAFTVNKPEVVYNTLSKTLKASADIKCCFYPAALFLALYKGDSLVSIEADIGDTSNADTLSAAYPQMPRTILNNYSVKAMLWDMRNMRPITESVDGYAVKGDFAIMTLERFEEGYIPFMHEVGDNTFEVITDSYGNGVLSAEKLAEKRALFSSSYTASDIDRFVVEYDIKLLSQNSNFNLCQFKSETGEWSTNVVVANGYLKGFKGKTSTLLPVNKWKKLSFAFCTSKSTFDMYIDGELIESGIAWQSSFTSPISEIRLTMPETSGYVSPAKFYVDNYCVYASDSPEEIPDDYFLVFPPYSILPSSASQDEYMTGKTGFHTKSKISYINGERTETDISTYESDGSIMVPIEFFKEVMSISAQERADGKTAVINGNISLKSDSTVMTVSGKTIILSKAPETTDGKLYAPLEEVGEKALGKYVYYDNSVVNGGMIIIDDTEFDPPSSEHELQALNNYLMFLRPSAQWLSDKLEESGYVNVHPRLFVDEASIKTIKEGIKTNSVKKSWYKKLVSECERYKTIPLPDYGTYDGTRMSRAPAMQAAQMGFLYLLTGDKSWVDAAWPKLERVCSWPDWNPDNEFLDTAQFSLHVATAYDWMYNALTEEQRAIVEEALYDKCIIEAKKWWYGIKGPKDKWQIGTANWNPVCNSGISIGALSVLDVYPEEAGEIISLCTRGLEYVSTRFAPDGAWFEGPAYWDFVFRLLTRYIAAFDKIYNTSFGIDKFEGLDRAASTLLYSQSENGTFNYSDADVEVIYPDTLYYLSNHYNLPAVTAITLDKSNAELSDAVYIPYALAWYDISVDADDAVIDLPYDSVFSGDGAFAVMRDSWYDKNGTYVGIKAGKAVYNHSHLDLGSFIYETEGVRWAIDLGKDSYSLPDYWASNDNRWRVYRTRAEGHNTIIINPDDTGIDMNLQATAKITEQKSSPGGAITVVDMTEALSDNATAAKRGFYLTDNRKSLVVRDEITLKQPTDKLYWAMHTKADSAQIDGSRVIISSGGKQLLVEFESNSDFEISFTQAKAMDGTPTVEGENQNVGINKLMLKVTGSGNVNITAKLTPLDADASAISEYNIPIDQWQLP